MPKKTKHTVWNKKQAKISSSKILKTQKNVSISDKEDTRTDPLGQFVKKFDAQIRKACEKRIQKKP